MSSTQTALRSGYTTGACATAAAKGALLALLHQRRFTKAQIRLPIGQSVTFALLQRFCQFFESVVALLHCFFSIHTVLPFSSCVEPTDST